MKNPFYAFFIIRSKAFWSSSNWHGTSSALTKVFLCGSLRLRRKEKRQRHDKKMKESMGSWTMKLAKQCYICHHLFKRIFFSFVLSCLLTVSGYLHLFEIKFSHYTHWHSTDPFLCKLPPFHCQMELSRSPFRLVKHFLQGIDAFRNYNRQT